jgi:lipoprotein-anchoring transpeptidase ErfK/SrfK
MLRNVRRAGGTAAIALLLGLSPIYTAHAAETSSIEAEATELRPGRSIWRPEAATEGPVEVVVSLPQQLAYVYRGDTLIGMSTVSTGMEGHETPTGSFSILQKRERHFSNRYNNAPMPFMQRLTWDGIALHAGAIPGTPASHGCVRFPMAFARHLYGVTQLGARVHIVNADIRDTGAILAYARRGFEAEGGMALASGASD